MTPTRDVAAWVARTEFADLPPRVVEEAKSQVLSVLGAVYAGAGTEAAEAVRRVVVGWPGCEEATCIPGGERTSVANALYVNATASMALDYDDYLFAGHTGHSAVLASLALAEKLGADGRALLTAQVLANEVEGRVGASVLLGPLNGQLWSFIHLVGGAVAAAKLRGFDAERVQGALGIALLQPNYPLAAGFFGSEAKALLAAQPVVAGVQAADLAAAGLAGAPDVLEHPQGFVRTFAREPLWGAFGGLGRTWLTDTLCYKIYPGCAYVDTVVDCVLNLVKRHRPEAARVRRVSVSATPLTVGMEALVAPHLRGPESTPTTLNFTVGYRGADRWGGDTAAVHAGADRRPRGVGTGTQGLGGARRWHDRADVAGVAGAGPGRALDARSRGGRSEYVLHVVRRARADRDGGWAGARGRGGGAGRGSGAAAGQTEAGGSGEVRARGDAADRGGGRGGGHRAGGSGWSA